eukprot:CAMPEP_0183308342 /NCGR_PEP_ID=MMETSP0160_2-20130417/21449_1 /TAXON_ID=2839 ORGANISM="Odontella Sinensis, Strain Grunow 1884" /NCGR_SAMPLE_ID=MMETSP0160_2 /ASSEMBLY_ACC=CAM_ASM_000250 /LENGTH=248 /DNA_ID=CAMNT_0025472165 /DNA_START=54 /DNA_END=797 /DNA_ORIENTATION=+
MAVIRFFLAALLLSSCDAFSGARCSSFFSPSSGCRTFTSSISGLSMAAKKRRRRRKDAQTDEPKAPSAEADIDTDPMGEGVSDGELPDFDLFEDEPVASASDLKASSVAASSSTGVSMSPIQAMDADMSDPRVMEAMKGSKSASIPMSSDDLVRDRALEKSMSFSPVNEPLPNLGEFAKKSRGVSESGGFVDEGKVGKKRARAEARRAAAIEAEEAEAGDSGFSLDIPQIKGEDGKVSPIKILETGTW